MISSTLYHQFPTVSYNGELVTNLTVRLKFQKMVQDNLMVFYPYTVSEGERADMIAYDYYRDANYAWLIYLANDIYNPLEDWPRPQDQLDKYIANKYGSIEAAYEKIMFYRVEWESDESMLTASGYAALPPNLKKYWTPTYNGSRQVSHFIRSEVDWTIDTNRVVQLTVTGNSAPIAVGDYVYQRPGGVKTAQAEVCAKNADGSINVKHVIGEFTTANTVSVFVGSNSYGTCSNTAVVVSSFRERTITDGITTAIPGMETNEENYWVPVTAYDYEVELNESKKHIRLLDPSHITQIESNIRMLVAE